MKIKLLNTLVILAMVLSLPVIATGSVLSGANMSAKEPIAIGAQRPSSDHLVMPRDEFIIASLEGKGLISDSSTPEDVEAAVAQYKVTFAKKSNTWVNPQMEKFALEREEQLASGSPMAPEAIQPVDVMIFALAVDFDDGSDETVYFDDVYSVDGCATGTILSDTFSGPRVGNIPYPDDHDNNTVWYNPYSYSGEGNPSWYNNLIYGYDGVGWIRTGETTDPILEDPRFPGESGINLEGYTVQDYYDHVVGPGYVNLDGGTYGWVTVDHPEAYYGADNCNGASYGGAYDFNGVDYTEVPVSQLVYDAVQEFNADLPGGFNWADYDQNEDQIVDTFWVIYAGMGQEAGGGSEGDFALWSHSSDTKYYFPPMGIQVDGEDTPGDPDDDIFVGPYTMQPENADVGVMVEEFGHNVFGLPDLYVTDTQGSIAFWDIMEAGAWGGYLGGATPVGMPLWFRMIAQCGSVACNWQVPMLTREFDDLSEEVTLRQLEEQTYDSERADWGPSTPGEGTYKGVRINLPDVKEEIFNEASTGNAAWSATGNDSTFTMTRTITVPSTGANLLTMLSYWDIEYDYDYGYFDVYSGGTWTSLADTGGYMISAPLGYGLTGYDYYDTLEFDLSAYAGTTIDIRFSYVTDPAANGKGWWIDDLMLDDVLIDDFETATLPATFPGWTNSGWKVVPYTAWHAQYYLVEWRNATKYDQMVRTAYVTTDSGDDLWEVERVPYNIPGALVYYRNTTYGSTYSQLGNYFDPPSYGPKYQLLVVDMNWDPIKIGDTGYVFYPTVGSYDAALTLDSTDPFTISQVYSRSGPIVGPFNYGSRAPITNFNDTEQYYSGYVWADDDLWLGYDDSAVIPARDLYSVSVWDLESGTPFIPFIEYYYGVPDGTSWFGFGKPGDDNVQYGVNIELLDQGSNGEYGVLKFYNYSVDMPTTVTGRFVGGEFVETISTVVTNNSPRNVFELYMDYYPDYYTCEDIQGTAVSNLYGSQEVVLDSYPYAGWESPEEGLESGEEVKITITCTMDLGSMVGDWSFATETWVEGNDGQVERGGWYFENEYDGFLATLPFILFGNLIP